MLSCASSYLSVSGSLDVDWVDDIKELFHHGHFLVDKVDFAVHGLQHILIQLSRQFLDRYYISLLWSCFHNNEKSILLRLLRLMWAMGWGRTGGKGFAEGKNSSNFHFISFFGGSSHTKIISFSFQIRIHETIGNRCWVRLSLLTSTASVMGKHAWRSGFMLVSSFLPSSLELSSRATPLGRLYTGPFPLCWKQSGLPQCRRRWKRSSTNRWPIPGFSVCSSTNLQLEKIDDAFAHTLWGNKKRANYCSSRGKNFHFAHF